MRQPRKIMALPFLRELPVESKGSVLCVPLKFSTRLKVALRSRRGFSLVEVTMALGITAFSFSVIFGLLGVGLTSFRQSKAVGVSAQIAQQVFSQLQSIPFDTLVKGTNASATPRSSAATLTTVQYANSMTVNGSTVSTLYFDELGNQLSSSTGEVYTVNVRIAFPTPILPSTVSSGSPVLNIDLATVMVQVALNPGNVTPPYDSSDASSTKWLSPTMQIINYQFFVTRNN